ncbi:MAG: CHAD domain-containing protein [Anaerolineae bacterium]|nr:CHAD domain-containing protein [Anaerolineae bacterium]
MGKKKDISNEQLLEMVQAQMQPVQPEDAITEAGRKVLQGEFVKILQYDAGARTGEDIENVHKMRVAIRQTRSAFRLLDEYFQPGVLRTYRRDLRKVMRALASVRDLDVMIHDLSSFELPAEDGQANALRDVIDSLDQRRVVARRHLIETLDSKGYRRFLKNYVEFLTTPGAGARSVPEGTVVPFQVRHVLPPLIYQHLAAVRAYEPVLDSADGPTFHALRIEFKRLRYVVSLFSGVLGKDIGGFINELKQIQDVLGRMNDIEVAREALTDLMEDLDGDENAALWLYLGHLEREKPALHDQFPAVWQRFNTKTVQRKLASAVAAL